MTLESGTKPLVALHGLECKWLLQRDDESYQKLNSGEGQSKKRWEQRAFLTPVLFLHFTRFQNSFSYSKMTPQKTWIKPPLSVSGSYGDR